MPRKPAIPIEVHDEVQKLIDDFNKKNFKASPLMRAFFGNKVKPGYVARFKGKFLYCLYIGSKTPAFRRQFSTPRWRKIEG